MLCGIYKLPNISIRYTGTWKDSLKFGVGMATTAAGIILALLGGGSEILTGGVSTAISVPAAASGIAIAGTGLAISGSALANMFDVRIQKSESNKGKGDGERGNSSNELKDVYNSIKDSPDYPKEFEAVKNGTTKNTIKNKELLDKLREIESVNGLRYIRMDIILLGIKYLYIISKVNLEKYLMLK